MPMPTIYYNNRVMKNGSLIGNSLRTKGNVPKLGVWKVLIEFWQERKKRKRQLAAELEKRRHKGRLSSTSTIASLVGISSCEEESSQESQESSFIEEMESEATSSSSRKATTATVSLPVKDLITSTAATALKFRVREIQHAALLASTLNTGCGDLSQFTLSRGSANHHRRQVIKQRGKEVRKNYVPPKFATVHWDSKIFKRKG